LPIAELLTPSDALRDAITRGATAHEIRAAMRAAGYPTMRDQAMRLVAEGLTSIEEVDRVLANDETTAAARRAHSRILVTDDEPITRMLVKLLLERERFEVLEAANGKQAVEIAVRERPDLVLIDLNMPEMDGYEAIGRLRRDFTLATLPIVVLTSEEGPGVEKRVLELGADDYITKPFSPKELVARVRVVFRRIENTLSTNAEMIRVADLTLDVPRMRVTAEKREIEELTPTEFELLATLARQPGRIFTRAQLLDAIHGVAFESYERAIDAHIKNIRRKIEVKASEPKYILTVYGVGYKFADK
jgi:DNA-binding response OmpR family regulator